MILFLGSQVRSNKRFSKTILKMVHLFGNLFQARFGTFWPVGKKDFIIKSQACIYISKNAVD